MSKAKKPIVVKVYLHGDKESAAEQASELAKKLGYEEYSEQYEGLFRAVFLNEIEVTVEIDPVTFASKILSAKEI